VTLGGTWDRRLLLEYQSRAYGTSTVSSVTSSLVLNPELAAVMRAVGTHSYDSPALPNPWERKNSRNFREGAFSSRRLVEFEPLLVAIGKFFEVTVQKDVDHCYSDF
jgi:hypothetical protein